MTKVRNSMNQKNNGRKLGKQTKAVSEKTRKTILKAALKVFAREGFSDAKLREIADHAGTTHSLIRHHFGSKDDLWMAVVDYSLRLHENGLKKILATRKSEDPVELFKKFISSYITTMAKYPELSNILLHDNSRKSPHLNYLHKREKQLHDIVEPVFKEVQACGHFIGFDHDSLTVYLRGLVETPIATRHLSNKRLKVNIRSKEGIAMHKKRVLGFLFPESS